MKTYSEGAVGLALWSTSKIERSKPLSIAKLSPSNGLQIHTQTDGHRYIGTAVCSELQPLGRVSARIILTGVCVDMCVCVKLTDQTIKQPTN